MQNDQNAEISFAKDSEIQKFGKTFQLILWPVLKSGWKMNGEICTNAEIQNDQNTQITNDKIQKWRTAANPEYFLLWPEIQLTRNTEEMGLVM